jgi:multidrug efflux pump subunit AcrA (membrane-fusion protein)
VIRSRSLKSCSALAVAAFIWLALVGPASAQTTTTAPPETTTTTAPAETTTTTEAAETIGTIKPESFATFALFLFLSLGVVSGSVLYRGVRR